MAAITEAEKHWKRRITDPTLTDEQRNEAALRYDRIVKRRQKTKTRGPYNKTVPEEPMYSPFDGESLRDYRARHDEWARRYPKAAAAADAERAANGQRLVGHDVPVVSMPTPKSVAKPAPAPKIVEALKPEPAPVVEQNPYAEMKRLLAESAKVVRSDVPQPQPIKKAPIPQGNFPILPGATIEESKSCWLLDGWGTKMKPDEYAYHCAIRAEYDRRMTEQREMQQMLTASLPKTAEEIAAEEAAAKQRTDEAERSKARAFAPPAFVEPNRGNPLTVEQLKELQKPTMAGADGGISIEPSKRNWLPDLKSAELTPSR
jgi:hypothetical protein